MDALIESGMNGRWPWNGQSSQDQFGRYSIVCLCRDAILVSIRNDASITDFQHNFGAVQSFMCADHVVATVNSPYYVSSQCVCLVQLVRQVSVCKCRLCWRDWTQADNYTLTLRISGSVCCKNICCEYDISSHIRWWPGCKDCGLRNYETEFVFNTELGCIRMRCVR